MTAPHVQIETATGKILAEGFFPSGVPNAALQVVAVTPAIAAALAHFRTHTLVLNPDGSVTETPFPSPSARKAAILPVTVEDFRTTTNAQTTMVAWPLALQTLYTARFTLLAIDVGNADCRVWHATATAKRVNNGAAPVGAGTIVSSHADAGAASWGVVADTSGNTFRIRVTGAAGRTISWSLLGEIVRSRTDGLVD